jgi:hypothetical protein
MSNFDAGVWAERQFGRCELGDRRRTKRLVQMAQQVANNPSASLPDQTETWSGLKAAYRLFDNPEVTFTAVAQGHWQQTRQQPAGRYLILGDTTELDFGGLRNIEGAGPTGNGGGLGFLLHTGLLVDAQTRAVAGVAGATIHYRRRTKTKKTRENASQRVKRKNRESQVWGRVIDAVGPPPMEVEWVHVFDRGADDFEVYCHLLANRCEWVIRASKMSRIVVDAAGQRRPVAEVLPELKIVGAYELSLRARPGQAARTAQLQIRVGKIWLPRPRFASPYVKQSGPGSIPMHVVWVGETDPPAGVEPIQWVLYTSLPVGTLAAAWQVIEYYECRWLIEEYHKALKTGCAVTRHELRTAKRLEALVGLLTVVAVRLLALKSAARVEGDRPAAQVVPGLWLQMLKAARNNLHRVHDLTVRQFYRELAKLGGFLGRKHDGEPGWITIWRGWEKLNTLVRGAQLNQKLRNCG